MGTYRLALALLVVVSHLGITINGLNPGVEATVSFFLLSGFVMTALIRKSYDCPERIGLFFVDRLMRLYPQFFAYTAATLLLVVTTHPASAYLSDVTPFKVLLNFLMLPMGFYEFGLSGCMLVVAAWTIGLECTFYLIIPFLVMHQRRLAAALVSAGVFATAYFAIIEPDLWGYRLLPGTLFIFLSGSLLHDRPSKARNVLLLVAWLIALGMLLLIPRIAQAQHVWNGEVLTGFVVGLPAVALLSRLRSGKLDLLLGNLSYGVFLNHGLLLLMAQAAGFDPRQPAIIIAILVCSPLLALVTYHLIERPVINRRHALRRRSTLPGLVAQTSAP